MSKSRSPPRGGDRWGSGRDNDRFSRDRNSRGGGRDGGRTPRDGGRTPRGGYTPRGGRTPRLERVDSSPPRSGWGSPGNSPKGVSGSWGKSPPRDSGKGWGGGTPGNKTPSGGWGNSSEKATAGDRSPGGNLIKHF